MKKFLSALLASTMALSLATVGASAYEKIAMAAPDASMVVNEYGETYSASNISVAEGSITLENVTPNSVIYIPIYNGTDAYDGSSAYFAKDFRDSKLYSFKSSKDENPKLVKSIEYVDQKNLGAFKDRPDWIKVILNDSTMTSEQKFEGTVTFKARKNANEIDNPYTADGVAMNDAVTLYINLWVNNQKVEGADGSAGTGDRIYFNPEKNETNTLVWGDDRAALRFEADNDASKFYARLSVKSNSEIYNTYGDPANADLWFFDFVGNPSVPATSRATLTLGYPWSDGDEYAPNAGDCFIYEIDADGKLTDVTKQFTYSEDEEEIPGWSIKTRRLGTYLLSDVELDIRDSDKGSSSSKPSSEGDKKIPNTGSGDMVNVAVIAAVLSMAAAGAVAFRKASK